MTDTGGQTIDITEIIDRQRLGWFNVGLIVLGWLAMFADGYDVTTIAYAAPELVKEWHISRAALGPVFSSSLIAYFIGSIGLGWVGDHFGRKKAIIAGCLWFGLCSLATVAVTGIQQLFWLRFLTGLGLSGILPNVIAMGVEYSPRRLRAFLAVVMFGGLNLGGAAGGWAAAILVGDYGWRALFVAGGVLPCVFALLIFLFMPESIKFLTLRGGRPDEVARLVGILRPDFPVPVGARFVVLNEMHKVKFRPQLLFSRGLAVITPMIWAMTMLNMVTVSFLVAWLATLFQAAGLPTAQAAIASSMEQFGGIFGGFLASFLLDRIGPLAIAGMMLSACVALAAFGLPGLTATMLMAISFAVGFCVSGLQLALNAVPSLIYPTAYRANGTGWAIAVGRLGAVAGPLLGGVLIGWQLPMGRIFLLLVVPEAIAGCICLGVARLCYRRFHSLRLDDKPALAALATGD